MAAQLVLQLLSIWQRGVMGNVFAPHERCSRPDVTRAIGIQPLQPSHMYAGFFTVTTAARTNTYQQAEIIWNDGCLMLRVRTLVDWLRDCMVLAGS